VIDLQTEKRIQADASFTVGGRVFYVVCEVSSIKAFGGKAGGTIVSPAALLVDEGGRLYSISLGGEDMSVEQILRLMPSLEEKIRRVRAGTPSSLTVAWA